MIDQIVVSDTNVFIDLIDADLLDVFFQLPWEIHTTDAVILELKRQFQLELVNKYIQMERMKVVTFEAATIMQIARLCSTQKGKSNVSMTDCTVWYYAKENGYKILTGDRQLRNAALKDGVEVHGVLYIFDKLVENSIIPEFYAAKQLRVLFSLNPRLPKDEIDKRLRIWERNNKKEEDCQ